VETAAKNLEMAAKTKQKKCEHLSAEVNAKNNPVVFQLLALFGC
jgi:hypothetical protein